MKIKQLPVSERPREKFLKYGSSNLSDAELLSIVLKTGTRDLSVLELSYNLLNEIGDLKKIKDISYDKLIHMKGIGSAKGIELLALVELSKRIYYDIGDSSLVFDTPDTIYNFNKYLFDNTKQEKFYCLYLDSKKQLIERKLLFMGTLNKSVVHPREVFKEAYRLSAASIICIHNHPSSDVTPSLEDINLTNSLVEIGKMNGIPVVDHIIFGEDKYYSFYENNRKIRSL